MESELLALPQRRFRPKRYRPGNLGTWSGHLAFANDLVATLRPAVLVELGTHYGESYFGFCQAVEENGVDCRCWAVDTWLGDEHAGFYDESVYREVSAYNLAHYQRFSQLVRTTFDEASERFADGSVDLLHIDGLHTFEAVHHDFEQWLPKVRPGGIILIHDIEARHANFAVWRLWEELRSRFRTFEFHHSWGLGVVQKPGVDNSAGRLAEILFSAVKERARTIRDQYGMAAEVMETRHPVQPGPLVQVFAASENGSFSEEGSAWTPVEPGLWQHHILELPQGPKTGVLRLDVINFPALIDLDGITIRRAVDRQVILQLSKGEGILELPCNKEVVALPAGLGPNFFSCGFDPHLLITAPEGAITDVGIQVELWMRVTLELSGLSSLLRQVPEAQRDLAISKAEALRTELQVHHAERLVLHGEIRRLATARDTMSAQTQQLRRSLELEQDLRMKIETDLSDAQRDIKRINWENSNRHLEYEKERKDLKKQMEALEKEVAGLDRLTLEKEDEEQRRDLNGKAETLEDKVREVSQQVVELRAAREMAEILLHQEETRHRAILDSYSWKITGPLRRILGVLRPGPKGKPHLP